MAPVGSVRGRCVYGNASFTAHQPYKRDSFGWRRKLKPVNWIDISQKHIYFYYADVMTVFLPPSLSALEGQWQIRHLNFIQWPSCCTLWFIRNYTTSALCRVDANECFNHEQQLWHRQFWCNVWADIFMIKPCRVLIIFKNLAQVVWPRSVACLLHCLSSSVCVGDSCTSLPGQGLSH